MATIIFEYDARKIGFQKLIDAFVAFGAKIKDNDEDLTMKSIKELRSGKVTRCKDYNDYLRKAKNI